MAAYEVLSHGHDVVRRGWTTDGCVRRSPNEAQTTAKLSIVPLPAAATTLLARALLSTEMFSTSDSTDATDPSRDDDMMAATTAS